jgi:hypothetical protein
VTIDVPKVKGPHRREGVERDMRRTLWVRVVECYRLGAHKEPALRGKWSGRVEIKKNGVAFGAKAGASTFKDAEVDDCLRGAVGRARVGGAKAGSTASVEIAIGPGADPMEPPAGRIVPGGGAIDAGAIASALGASLPAFERCYEAGLAYAPELWGRLALRLRLTEAGVVDEAFEIESRFPDEHVARCVRRAAIGFELPPPSGGDARVVVALRLSPAP